MTVATETFGYNDKCCISHEFLRRACTVTPRSGYWAGDILVYTDKLIKQSEVNDMRGGDCETEIVYPKQNTACSDIQTGIPEQYAVEETDIRTGAENSFEYLIPKAENPEDEHNWEIGIYQSTDDCGKMRDGGDAFQELFSGQGAISICGTVQRTSGMFPMQVHFLDNRMSCIDDPDNGLLVAIRTGAVWAWELRYAPKELNLSSGLSASDDITLAFREVLELNGMTDQDVFEFGMI